MAQIKSIKAQEILDSRGFPTLEVELTTEDGCFLASVPAGTSKGKYEALELRDGGLRYLGMGVTKAIKNVNKTIAPKLIGKDPTAQKEIDELLIKLDGRPNKSRLGANAILGVSVACLKAGAAAKKMRLWQWIAKLAKTEPSLPAACFVYLEGGLHGKSDLDIQEFMVFFQAKSFKEQLRIGTEAYHALGELLRKKYGKRASGVGLEGAFSPPFQETTEALGLILQAVRKIGFKKRFKIVLDAAASHFFKQQNYFFEAEILRKEQLLDFYVKLCKKYPIYGLEDPFSQDDWPSFQLLTQKIGSKTLVIGDDFLCTNLGRMALAAQKKSCNGLILKPNQVGTFTETVEAAQYALKHNWQVFIKHRSGETHDAFIADLAVGLGTGWIMAGAPTRGERVSKYNRLLRIEEEMKSLNRRK